MITPNESNGGQAFPYSFEFDGSPGMTLRDWFAGMALQGLLAKVCPHDMNDWVVSSATRTAFEFADAMIAQREKEG